MKDKDSAFDDPPIRWNEVPRTDQSSDPELRLERHLAHCLRLWSERQSRYLAKKRDREEEDQ